MLQPLHQLHTPWQPPWSWSTKCEEAFAEAKIHLAKAPVLTHYDPRLCIVLAEDASVYGVGTVISHQQPDGRQQPIAYASCTLNSSLTYVAAIFDLADSILNVLFVIQQQRIGLPVVLFNGEVQQMKLGCISPRKMGMFATFSSIAQKLYTLFVFPLDK